MLYIVATPIGNLRDITLRAIAILKEADLILAEDTRRTKNLLDEYQIKIPMRAYHDHNKEQATPKILKDLAAGKSIALVSDSGTPGISDPGFYLVRECAENNIPVSPVPGPNAAISALVCSGLPTDRFCFYGFLPKKKKKRKEIFSKIICTTIFYESPYRVESTVQLMAEVMPEKKVVIARELTKKFEEFIRGTSKEVYEKIKGRKLKGEIVIISEG